MNPPATLAAVSARHVLVDGAFRPATLRIEDGRISAIDPLDPQAGRAGAALHLPDTARLIPGIVDTHVHINEPGRTTWEGFATATRAAALGGVTTLIDMPLNSIPATTTRAALAEKRAVAAAQVAVDVGFWGGAVPDSLGALESLWDDGVFGFKCFLADSGVPEFPALDGGQLQAALAEIAGFDGLLIVHAEDADVLAAAPHPPSRAYADFLRSRPDEAETSAIARLVDGVRESGCRAHVLHLSSARALDLLADARAEGLPITVETCPHYLCIAAEQIPDAAAEFKCCPPIRDDGNRDALWDALRDGIIDCVVSDHSPATAEMKDAGGGDLQQAWGGISGLQVGFTAVAAEAAARGIDLAQVVGWMSTGTADLVGLATKGRIRVGADADLVSFDTAVALDVDVRELAHRNPISAYDGRHFDASVTHTVLRGDLLGSPLGSGDGGGRLLSRIGTNSGEDVA